jgi:hypothetical protein
MSGDGEQGSRTGRTGPVPDTRLRVSRRCAGGGSDRLGSKRAGGLHPKNLSSRLETRAVFRERIFAERPAEQARQDGGPGQNPYAATL